MADESKVEDFDLTKELVASQDSCDVPDVARPEEVRYE